MLSAYYTGIIWYYMIEFIWHNIEQSNRAFYDPISDKIYAFENPEDNPHFMNTAQFSSGHII